MNKKEILEATYKPIMDEEGQKIERIMAKISHVVHVIDKPKFSFYHCPVTNTQPNAQITLLDTFHLVKDESDTGYKARTLKLRSISGPEAASLYKRTHFDFITASNHF